MCHEHPSVGRPWALRSGFTVKLWAISDLHVRYEDNRTALGAMPGCPDDWLILGGDVGETEAHLVWTLETLAPKFKKLLWVPGNHELWGTSVEGRKLPGPEKYQRLVDLCRRLGVLTPEDPYVVWPGPGPKTTIALCFVGYDYSFRPPEVPESKALAWAEEAGIRATDEAMIDPGEFGTMKAWCHARVALTESRLAEIPKDHGTVLVNHFPLRHDLVWIPRVPRFSLWCGTTRTEDWHRRFNAKVVVNGHLHVRSGQLRDQTRFEEVSLGYPRQWTASRGAQAYLRLIWE